MTRRLPAEGTKSYLTAGTKTPFPETHGRTSSEGGAYPLLVVIGKTPGLLGAKALPIGRESEPKLAVFSKCGLFITFMSHLLFKASKLTILFGQRSSLMAKPKGQSCPQHAWEPKILKIWLSGPR